MAKHDHSHMETMVGLPRSFFQAFQNLDSEMSDTQLNHVQEKLEDARLYAKEIGQLIKKLVPLVTKETTQ
jgi:hypothetical protein